MESSVSINRIFPFSTLKTTNSSFISFKYSSMIEGLKATSPSLITSFTSIEVFIVVSKFVPVKYTLLSLTFD